MDARKIDKMLAEKFPKNMYEHSVNYYLPGNGTGYMDLCVGDINETKMIAEYLKEIGADEVYIESTRNKYGSFDIIIFHMIGDEKKFDYKTSEWIRRD